MIFNSRRYAGAVFITLAPILAGCGLLFPSARPAESFYVLYESGASLPQSDQKQTVVPVASLLVGEVRASALLAGQKILYSSDHLTRSAYQLAHWAEPPVMSIQRALVERFEKTNRFTFVARSGGIATGDLLLTTELLDSYHDISGDPAATGQVRMVIRAELVNIRTARIIATKIFRLSAPATDYSARGAVEGFHRVLEDLLRQSENWVLETLHVHTSGG